MPRGKRNVIEAEGQISLAPKKPIAWDSYEVAHSDIVDPLLGASNPDKGFLDNIKEFGVLQSVLLRKIPGEARKYRVIAGRRRIVASRIAGFPKVPARIPQDDDGWTDDDLLGLIENDQRSDNPVATLHMIENLIAKGHNEQDIAKAMHVDLRKVRSHMTLQNLTPAMMGALGDGRLTASTAERIAKLSTEDQNKLNSVLNSKGKIIGIDVMAVQQETAQETASAQPDMFSPEGPGFDPIARATELFKELRGLFPDDAEWQKDMDYWLTYVQTRVPQAGVAEVDWTEEAPAGATVTLSDTVTIDDDDDTPFA